MSGDGRHSTLAELRCDFDRAFTEAPADGAREREVDFLAIRLGDLPYALRLSEVAGIHADRRITPVPTDARGLLGLAGIGGVMVAVYDLGRLLGAGGGGRRWLALATGRAGVAFAFEQFEGHFRVPEASIAHDGEASPVTRRAAVPLGGVVRPVVPLAALLAELEAGVARDPSGKER